MRKALLDFKSTGKFVMAYADVYAQRDYYLASAADEVYVNPVGVLDFKGLATEVLFIKNFKKSQELKWKSFATESTKAP